MTTCNDCVHDKKFSIEKDNPCIFCVDYCNYKSGNKRTFLWIVIIPEIIIFIGLIVWKIMY